VAIPRVVRSATAESETEMVAVVAVFWVAVEMRNMYPSAAPLVMRRSLGVAAVESSPGVHPAEVSVKVVDVTLENLPTDFPLNVAVSSKGREMRDIFLTAPVPAVMVVLSTPDGATATD